MHFEQEVKGNSLIVRLGGELDMVVADEFRSKIEKTLDENPVKNIIINLRDVSFIDSSGLGVILGRYKRISQDNGRMAVVNAQPQVMRILELSGILRIMNSYESEEKALKQWEEG